MANFSLDIVSEYDKAEMNNVFAGVERDISQRYDFKGTPAAIEWLDDKKGYKIIGASDWQLEAITDLIRKHLASRGQTSKTLDLTKEIVPGSMKFSQEIPFVEGLDQAKAKKVTALIRENFAKSKPQIQGEAVRVTSNSKDDLQAIMKLLREADLDFAVSFTNFR